MRSFSIVAFLGLVAAQASDCTSISSCTGAGASSSSFPILSSTPSDSASTISPTSSAVVSSSPSPSPSPSPSAAATAITVAKDGSGQFTAINAAVNAAQNSGIATVTVLPGTYNEAVTVLGTATVTIVGATSAPAADWSQNQVTVSFATSPLSINTNNVKGVTLRNINFVNSVPAAGVVTVASLRGANVAFYGCSLVSAGQGAVSSSLGTAFFYNSYIEGTDKLFYNVPTIYVYQSTIVPTGSSANIVYNKGATSGGVFYNSTVVVDSSTVQQKSGLTNTNVYLGAPNGAGAVAIYRNTVFSAFMAPAGVHPAAASVSSFYGEYGNTGPGSYAKNAATRASYDVLLSADTVALFTIEKVFGNGPAPFGSSSLAWIQQDVVNAIQAGYAVQPVGSVSSVAPASSSAAVSSSAIMSSSIAASSAVVASAASLSSAASISSGFASVSTISSQVSPSVSVGSSSLDSSALSLAASSGVSAASSLVSASTVPTLSSSAVITSSAAPSSSSVSCAATPTSGTFVVSKTPGPCEYSSIAAAIQALPNDSKPYTIQIGPGTYTEQLFITRNGKVTLIGLTNLKNDYTQNQVRIEFSSGRLTNLGKNEETPVLYTKKANDNSGLAVYNIDFVNTYPQTFNTAALAADFYGANIAAYGCSFIGFQDTLLANKGTQVFSNCYIEGSVDFIWGYSTAYFHKCMIVSNTPSAFITAHNRATSTAPGGYVFDSCMVTYNSAYGSNFGTTSLGRPWSQFAIAIYMNSYLDKHISSAGWSIWSTSNPQTSGVTFGEYNNAGPGAWNAQRASFATQLTAAQAQQYELSSWIGDTTWLDMATYNLVPSYSVTGPPSTMVPPTNSTLPSNGTLPTNGTAPANNTTSPVNVHPQSGTIPPTGAVIVDLTGANNAKFTTISAALASLPNDNSDQTVFVYPGSYNEQIAPINRPGAVRIFGYTTSNPGQSYKGNQVTITFSRGLSVSPLPAGHSNAETATFATASSKISLYNINMINTDNLDGAQPSYVTLAASIYGDKIAFYGCSFDGWQDTLLTGATSGYQYYESCYIGGAIDFIWGYSKAYFKGCTLGAKRKGSAVTAHSRASSSAIGGYIFDQCLFTAAPGAVDGLSGVFLGRPYSQYALVVVKNSYLDSVISPSGWKIWSATDPRTGAITFAEYNNSGPSNWENNVAARQAFGFATLLTSDSYSLSSVMTSTDWIDMTYWNSITTPMPTLTPVIPPTNVTVNGTSVFNGTAPPTGALIVSKSPITGVTTYSTIQAAMNAASTSSKTNATIFIYPGIYEEQLIITKSGHTIFQGYSIATDDYSKNQVTIQFSRGIDTQGTNGSNTDGATVYVKGNYFHAYNINFRNNFGTQQNMASLGFAVQSSKYAGLYGCQIYGNQDTLSISGNLFTFKTYIEGNVDFIYGSGSAYFLDSTISPNEDGISITAHKRAANTTSAGFVFDQCTIKPVAGLGPFKSVSLGRPWNNLARVAYVNCYYDSMISAVGWNPWSKSSPNTIGVQFGEYHNYGPGAGICGRASFSSQLSDANVAQYQLGSLFGTAQFIDYARIDTQPFKVGIGSAQTCATISASASSIIPTSTPLPSSSAVSSSLPIITVYTTVTLTASGLPITSTSSVKLTQTISVLGSDVIRTSVVKQTATTTVTSPDVTSTATQVVTTDVGLTITPSPVTKTSTAKSTVTEFSTITEAAKTTTIKMTTTIVSVFTSTPKAYTTTVSVGTTKTVTSTVTPKPVETTVTTTTSIQPTSTKTSTVQQGVVTVSSSSTKTTTKKTTTTLRCTPTPPLVRRGAVIPRAVGSTTTLTRTAYTALAGPTVVLTESALVATKTTSVKGSTSTLFVTSIVKTSTIEQEGTTHLATVTSTNTIGKTTTLKASTTTVFSTSLATKTSVSTIEARTATVTNTNTKYNTQTVVLPQQTVVITKTIEDAITTKVTLPASTETEYVTVTIGQKVTTVTVTAPPSTKTVVQKTTSTVFSTATKTAKC